MNEHFPFQYKQSKEIWLERRSFKGVYPFILDYYDANSNTTSQQVGPKSFPPLGQSSGLDHEDDFVIKGSPEQITDPPVTIKEGDINQRTYIRMLSSKGSGMLRLL